jgi:hypothetical protein
MSVTARASALSTQVFDGIFGRVEEVRPRRNPLRWHDHSFGLPKKRRNQANGDA